MQHNKWANFTRWILSCVKLHSQKVFKEVKEKHTEATEIYGCMSNLLYYYDVLVNAFIRTPQKKKIFCLAYLRISYSPSCIRKISSLSKRSCMSNSIIKDMGISRKLFPQWISQIQDSTQKSTVELQALTGSCYYFTHK